VSHDHGPSSSSDFSKRLFNEIRRSQAAPHLRVVDLKESSGADRSSLCKQATALGKAFSIGMTIASKPGWLLPVGSMADSI
jgi:hypothetical protein